MYNVNILFKTERHS